MFYAANVGQSRKYRPRPKPKATCHVMLPGEDVQVPSVQGFVVEGRRYSYRWFALVLTVHVPEEGAPLIKMASRRTTDPGEDRPQQRAALADALTLRSLLELPAQEIEVCTGSEICPTAPDASPGVRPSRSIRIALSLATSTAVNSWDRALPEAGAGVGNLFAASPSVPSSGQSIDDIPTRPMSSIFDRRPGRRAST